MSKLTVDIAPEILASKTIRPLVEQASDWLRELIPESDEPMQAEWTWMDNRPGEEVVALTLKGGRSSWTRLFSKRDLETKAEAEHEFNGLIRSVLRDRTHFLLNRLLASQATGE